VAYWLICLLLAGFVGTYLWACKRALTTLTYICKPGATVTVMFLLLYFTGLSEWLSQLVFVALLLSLLGDIFLMLPNDRFVPGLISFFLAHIAYSIAFLSGVDSIAPDISWSLPIIFGVGLLIIVWSQLQDLKYPVVCYAIVIMGMLLSTIERYQTMPSQGSLLLLVGAAIFVLSDSLIALERFKGPLFNRYTALKRILPQAHTLIILTYYAAQFLLVSGIIRTLR
jgi:uncharacterized membrane protein YhhN